MGAFLRLNIVPRSRKYPQSFEMSCSSPSRSSETRNLHLGRSGEGRCDATISDLREKAARSDLWLLEYSTETLRLRVPGLRLWLARGPNRRGNYRRLSKAY